MCSRQLRFRCIDSTESDETMVTESGSRKRTAIDCEAESGQPLIAAESGQPLIAAESGQPLIANIGGNRKRARSIVEIDLTLTFLQPNLYQMNF